MPSPTQQPLDYEPRKPPPSDSMDFWAYLTPMAIFMVFVWLGGQYKSLYAIAYVARAMIVPGALIFFWRHYTRIRWNFWWLGILVGVIGIVQWVGMQLLLQKYFSFFRPSPDVFDPTKTFENQPGLMYGFIAIRIASAALVVPVMEELFWRDFVWRTLLAPNDFKLAGVGEWELRTFLIVSVVFATVHGNWFATAIVWGMMIGALLVYTRSLGACIIAHGVTNLLLAGYVLYTRDWSFW